MTGHSITSRKVIESRTAIEKPHRSSRQHSYSAYIAIQPRMFIQVRMVTPDSMNILLFKTARIASTQSYSICTIIQATLL